MFTFVLKHAHISTASREKIPTFVRCGRATKRATDLRFTGRGFKSWLGTNCIMALNKLLTM